MCSSLRYLLCSVALYLFCSSGHLLVNLGFGIFSFFENYDSRDCCFLRNNSGEFSGEKSKNNEGVLGRPWTKLMVCIAISSTLKFQFTVNPES